MAEPLKQEKFGGQLDGGGELRTLYDTAVDLGMRGEVAAAVGRLVKNITLGIDAAEEFPVVAAITRALISILAIG